MKMLHKSISLLLSVSILLNMMPLSVFAFDNDPENTILEAAPITVADNGDMQLGKIVPEETQVPMAKEDGNISLAIATDKAYAVTGGNIYYGASGASMGYVTSLGIMGCDASVTSAIIPNEINGIPVTSISARAFSNCTSLTNILIPDSVTSIGTDAFKDCISLVSVSIPSGAKNIEDGTFSGCAALTRVTIPDSVTSIGVAAFRDCRSLTDVTIPDGVTSIEENAFENCASLVSFTVPKSVTAIEDQTFINCTSLTGVSIPDSVTTIGGRAFDNCRSLTDVLIPDSVTYIGSYAFSNCVSLTSVTIPDRVTYISYGAFDNCTSLISVTIPDSVVRIGQFAFSHCTSLATVMIPDSVTSLGAYAFEDCISLVCVTIPNSITEVESWIFSNCTSLASVIIPYNVTSIGSYTFHNCTSLASVSLPNSVTTIGYAAFFNCMSLTDIYYAATETQWNAIEIQTANESLTAATIHYNTADTGDEALANGMDPNVSSLHITDLYPSDICTGLTETIRMTFNLDIEARTGYIRIWDLYTDEEVHTVSVTDPALKINGSQVSYAIPEGALNDTSSYYITVDSGAFASAAAQPALFADEDTESARDSWLFYGIDKRGNWKFSTESTLYEGIVEMEYVKNDLFHNKTAPPIPNGSDKQYAELLVKWAEDAGFSGLDAKKLKAILDDPMYFPATETNNSTVLMNDQATTIRQTIEDIIFFDCLETYVSAMNESLSKVEKNGNLTAEAQIYEKVKGWVGQVKRYLKRREKDSNLLLSVNAPLAYETLIDDLTTRYKKPYLKADLDSATEEIQLANLKDKSDYSQIKKTVDVVSDSFGAGKTVYTAYVKGAGHLVKFSSTLLKYTFGQSDNRTMNQICEAMNSVNDITAGAALSSFLGSSIGFFPLAIDLVDKAFSKLKVYDETAYFIADYYMADSENAAMEGLYDFAHDDETGMRQADLTKISTESQYAHLFNNNPIIYNWALYTVNGEFAVNKEALKKVRFDLTNYAMLLRLAGSLDYDKVKECLILYILAEYNASPMTSISVQCPVTVKVYDMETKELLATLSSEEEILADNPYGSLYLLGENDEIKYFLLNSDAYYVEIEAYDDGVMDIMITNDDGQGAASTQYYENIALKVGDRFTTTTLSEDCLTKNDAQTIAQTERIPVSQIRINGDHEIAVGQKSSLAVSCFPEQASDKAITWSSSNEGILEVDESGVVTAIAEGTATIMAAGANGTSAEFSIDVYTAAEELACDISELTMAVGESYLPSVTVLPYNATHEVKWQSSNPSMIAIDEQGALVALNAGITSVIAEIDGIELVIPVTISAMPIEVGLYQSDVDGMRIKVDLMNRSSADISERNIMVALYDGEQMIDVKLLNTKLSMDEPVTEYFDVSKHRGNAAYSVSVFVLDNRFAPVQAITQMMMLPW